MARYRRRAILLSLIILATLTMACNDWDGLDRSGWAVTATAEAFRYDRPPWTPEP